MNTQMNGESRELSTANLPVCANTPPPLAHEADRPVTAVNTAGVVRKPRRKPSRRFLRNTRRPIFARDGMSFKEVLLMTPRKPSARAMTSSPRSSKVCADHGNHHENAIHWDFPADHVGPYATSRWLQELVNKSGAARHAPNSS